MCILSKSTFITKNTFFSISRNIEYLLSIPHTQYYYQSQRYSELMRCFLIDGKLWHLETWHQVLMCTDQLPLFNRESPQESRAKEQYSMITHIHVHIKFERLPAHWALQVLIKKSAMHRNRCNIVKFRREFRLHLWTTDNRKFLLIWFIYDPWII